MNEQYEAVIGLEVHVELATETKAFCACKTTFGAPPNTQCCPVCMGLPGALPVLNEKAVRYAALAGLATGCTVSPHSYHDRKNYFYPDLPKAYQISQNDRPLCTDGYFDIETAEGARRIRIERIHLEEDAGKLIHDREGGTHIDFNRCGVPLIEIVSAPDLRSADEAKSYLKKLRSVMRDIGISDCRMNEGSLRCDVNLSVRRVGETTLGTRTEMKNLNSFAFVGKAIESEFRRQVALLRTGETVTQQTMRFDPATGKTSPMRDKENASDYRYFREPDLGAIVLSKDEIASLRASLPELADARRARYVSQYGLSDYDSSIIAADSRLSSYFEAALSAETHATVLAHLLISDILRMCDAEEFSCPIAPQGLGALAELVGEEKINYATAKKLLPELMETNADPCAIVRERDLWQITDEEFLRGEIEKALVKNPRAIADFQAGKRRAAGQIVGAVMTATGGRADPCRLATLVEEMMAE